MLLGFFKARLWILGKKSYLFWVHGVNCVNLTAQILKHERLWCWTICETVSREEIVAHFMKEMAL